MEAQNSFIKEHFSDGSNTKHIRRVPKEVPVSESKARSFAIGTLRAQKPLPALSRKLWTHHLTPSREKASKHGKE